MTINSQGLGLLESAFLNNICILLHFLDHFREISRKLPLNALTLLQLTWELQRIPSEVFPQKRTLKYLKQCLIWINLKLAITVQIIKSVHAFSCTHSYWATLWLSRSLIGRHSEAAQPITCLERLVSEAWLVERLSCNCEWLPVWSGNLSSTEHRHSWLDLLTNNSNSLINIHVPGPSLSNTSYMQTQVSQDETLLRDKMMKMQPRFSFSVDSLLGRKTNEVDIKSDCLGGFTQIDSDHRSTGNIASFLIQIIKQKIVTKYFQWLTFLLQIKPLL